MSDEVPPPAEARPPAPGAEEPEPEPEKPRIPPVVFKEAVTDVSVSLWGGGEGGEGRDRWPGARYVR